MKNIFYLFIILIGYCYSCSPASKSSYNPNKKYSPAELQKEFSLLYDILKANHPSLYWYTPKDSVDDYFATAKASIQDSLTEQQFRNKISWAINKIHCGHTVARSSEQLAAYNITHRPSFFPLSLKVWDDSAVVINNFLKADSNIIKRGTIITAINSIPIKKIIDSLCLFIGTDGYANTFKYQLISFNFPAYYKNTFGVDSSYLISYMDSAGNLRERSVKNFDPRSDTLNDKPTFTTEAITRKKLRRLALLSERNFRIDTSLNTAFLSVNTFSEGRLLRFFKKSFKTIRKLDTRNVVLDLRLNSGGNVLACTRLTQYLADKPFRVADTVAAYNRSFPYKKYIHPWFIYWLSMHVSGKRLADGRIHFRYFERHYFKPKKLNHFNGNIYILTGGYTFSAATLVARSLKDQHNVTIVGEETGGGAYGNSAMHLTTIVLPASKIRVTLPLYRIVLDTKHGKDGRGVLPDIKIGPASSYIRMGIDSKLLKVEEIIKEKGSKITTAAKSY